MPIVVRHSFGFERLLTVWATREQNLLYITLCNEIDCVLTYTQSFTINGQSMWAEPNDFKQILASRAGFFVILPHVYHDGNIYNHIAHIQILKNGNGRITAWHGESYDIHEIKAYDTKSDILTFTSAGGAIGTMQLYKVSNANKLLEGADETHIPFDLPELSFELMELPSNYGKSDRSWEVDHFATLRLNSLSEAHVGIMKPPMFDPTMKYPLLVDVYGGPNSFRVRRVTPNPNMIYFSSHLNAIVVWIDGRGTSNRGWNLKSPVYKALGQYETQDTIDAVKLLISKYSYIDEQRVAIFGWSYGGFVSTYAGILDQGKTFKCAIAVAPVTDFMLYDNVHFQNSALLSETLQAELVHFTQLVYSNQDHNIGTRQAHLLMEIDRFLTNECFNDI
uniref:Peptidase_S9 domain-containing protein n=1 Tax=Angiostrongylus cantonensis TaxID=6313 RepID=A0A0K0D3R2_ANGCA